MIDDSGAVARQMLVELVSYAASGVAGGYRKKRL
jgi:hypothetical protein